VDHTRYDVEKSIRRKSIPAFKRNLSVLNGRYDDFEQRLLATFHERGEDGALRLDYGAVTDISVQNLMRDEMLTVTTPPQHMASQLPRGRHRDPSYRPSVFPDRPAAQHGRRGPDRRLRRVSAH
jgi:hypothetical protein